MEKGTTIACPVDSEPFANEEEFHVEDYDNLLQLNKGIVRVLLDLKQQVTSALRKCEQKLSSIERSLQGHTSGATKALICNAGMPYFKDRSYFFAPTNEDDVTKENKKELQVRNLLKVSPWTRKDRATVLKAIQNEVFNGMIALKKTDASGVQAQNCKSNYEGDTWNARQEPSPRDFARAVKSLQAQEFDWYKISLLHFEDMHSALDCRVMWKVFLHPDVNKKRWTALENRRLNEVAERNDFQDWDRIAEDLNTNRSGYQCFIRYNTTKRLTKLKNSNWQDKEDERLLKLINVFKIGDFIPWGEIASWMQNRTKQQVYFRWTYSLSPCMTKGRFTKTEDNVLKDAVRKYGTNFRKISAAMMPNRSSVQLHYRYQTMVAKQTVNWNFWSLEEDVKLLELFRRFGPHWAKISKEFSQKTRTQLRHRHTALQKYIKRGVTLRKLHEKQRERDRYEEQAQVLEDRYVPALEYYGDVQGDDRSYSSHVDQELIEYFRVKDEVHGCDDNGHTLSRADEPSTDVASALHDTLQRLNANLYIPDNVNKARIEEADVWLLRSFREYTGLKGDAQRYLEFIERHRMHMFDDTDNGSAVSLDRQTRPKKSAESLGGIDYSLSTEHRHVLEPVGEFSTPDIVVSHIGGFDEELQFQKLSSLLRFDRSPSSVKDSREHSARIIVDASDDDNDDDDDDHVERSLKNEKRANFYSTPAILNDFDDPDMHAMDTSHGTLVCCKNLMQLQRLNGVYNHSITIHSCIASDKFLNALNLLQRRLELMLKFPIGLSKIVLPEVHVADPFSCDDDDSSADGDDTAMSHKRKFPDLSPGDPRARERKKVRTVR